MTDQPDDQRTAISEAIEAIRLTQASGNEAWDDGFRQGVQSAKEAVDRYFVLAARDRERTRLNTWAIGVMAAEPSDER